MQNVTIYVSYLFRDIFLQQKLFLGQQKFLGSLLPLHYFICIVDNQCDIQKAEKMRRATSFPLAAGQLKKKKRKEERKRKRNLKRRIFGDKVQIREFFPSSERNGCWGKKDVGIVKRKREMWEYILCDAKIYLKLREICECSALKVDVPSSRVQRYFFAQRTKFSGKA